MISKPIFQSKIIYQFVKNVFPLVKKELLFWNNYAQNIPNQVLSQQALSSINKKSFHAQGGSIYGLYDHMNPKLIEFIVSLQTISDYLDNLCDRLGVEDEVSFLNLHQAITDGLTPDDHFFFYYKNYPYSEDIYLHSLVDHCKKYIRSLPSYSLIREEILYLGSLYSQMQSYKHISPLKREISLFSWANEHIHLYKNLYPWEFSAAAGSTLGIFLLCTLGQKNNLKKEDVLKTMDAYFPWVCGFHILLDYFIDEKEDLSTGDLNFVSYYKNDQEKEDRLLYFLKKSIEKVSNLENSLFHITIIEGLLAMYLSDPKASYGNIQKISKTLLKNSSYTANTLYKTCKILRKRKIIGFDI